MSYIPVIRQKRVTAWVEPKKYRKGYGCIPMNGASFTSDDAKQYVRFAAVSDWGFICKWITECSMSDYEFIAWLYLRDQLDLGLRWKVLVRWPSTDGLMKQNEMSFKLGFSVEEQKDYYRRFYRRELFRKKVHTMIVDFWKCFYQFKWCTTRKELIRWIGEYTLNTEWIREKTPGPFAPPLVGRRSRPPLKLKLPSTCLLLGQSGRTSRYVCLGFQSSDSMCQTFMSSSPAERASILKQRGTSTPKLG